MYRNDCRLLFFSKIKIAIVQFIGECAEFRSMVKLQLSRGKNYAFQHRVNSEIIGLKRNKFTHDVARLLSFNLLKVASRSSDPLPNARAEFKGRSWQRLRTPQNLTGCHSNVPWATAKRMSD